jgi:hypothetical protein
MLAAVLRLADLGQCLPDLGVDLIAAISAGTDGAHFGARHNNTLPRGARQKLGLSIAP